MRIAAKRLRYTLEIFEPVLPAESADLLKTIAGIQERIGAIHDCDVLFPLLHRTLAQEMKQERKSLHVEHDAAAPPPFLAAEGLVAHMTRKRVERETLYTEFLQFWDALPPERLGTALEHVIESVVGDRE
jgi:CHAD domain-containing protein